MTLGKWLIHACYQRSGQGWCTFLTTSLYKEIHKESLFSLPSPTPTNTEHQINKAPLPSSSDRCREGSQCQGAREQRGMLSPTQPRTLQQTQEFLLGSQSAAAFPLSCSPVGGRTRDRAPCSCPSQAPAFQAEAVWGGPPNPFSISLHPSVVQLPTACP